MANKNKELLYSAMVALVGVIYILLNTFMVPVSEKKIFDFIITTVIVPAVALILCGMICGRRFTLIRSLTYLSVIVFGLFGVSMLSMFYTYNTGHIFQMLENTKTTGDVLLKINESITLGTVVQQVVICFICACIGSKVGNKTVGVFSKIRN